MIVGGLLYRSNPINIFLDIFENTIPGLGGVPPGCSGDFGNARRLMEISKRFFAIHDSTREASGSADGERISFLLGAAVSSARFLVVG